VKEALDLLKMKIQSLNSFAGRQRLEKQEKVVYWSVFGLTEVLE
jgi:hypothetical protein